MGEANVAKKIKRAYIGDETGKARLFYTSGYVWKKYNTNTTTLYVYNQYNVSYQTTWDFERVDHSPPGRMNTTQTRWYKVDSVNDFDETTGTWSASRSIGIVGSTRIGWIGRTNRPTEIYDALGASWQPSTDDYLFLYYDSAHRVASGSTPVRGSLIGPVTVPSKQYPDNGVSGGYWWVFQNTTPQYSQGSYISDVEDDNPSAYPDNGRHTDGYWYVKQAE